jgi:hypothetical protein
MSEGGFLAWKRQNIMAPPIADYSDLKRPIQLPHGSACWHLDPKTKEWKVIKIQDNTNIAVGIPFAEPICADDKNEPKTDCQEAHHVDVVTEKNLIHAESKLFDDGHAKFISHVVQRHDTMQADPQGMSYLIVTPHLFIKNDQCAFPSSHFDDSLIDCYAVSRHSHTIA